MNKTPATPSGRPTEPAPPRRPPASTKQPAARTRLEEQLLAVATQTNNLLAEVTARLTPAPPSPVRYIQSGLVSPLELAATINEMASDMVSFTVLQIADLFIVLGQVPDQDELKIRNLQLTDSAEPTDD